MAQMIDHFPVVIIGGGLAGLAAAAHLAERGIRPLILESNTSWPGGRLSGGEPDTFTHGGKTWAFSPDHGVHAVWGGYVNMRAMLARYTDTELQTSAGEEWINRWGREVRTIEAGNSVRRGIVPAPFHYLQLLFKPKFWRTIIPLDFLSLPGFLFSILWTVGYDPIKEKSALDGLMLNDYFLGWTPNLKATFKGLGANLLAAPPETISAASFIAALRFYTMLRRDAWHMQYFPANSHDSLIQPLLDYIRSCGGEMVGGATATRLEPYGDSWRVVFEDSLRRGNRAVHAGQLILATNAPGAERLLTNSPATATSAASMPFPDGLRNVVIRLWFDVQPESDIASGMFTGDFLPDNFFWLHRLYDEFADWAATGGSAIEIHLYGVDKILDLPDRNLIIQAVDEVQRAFPEVRGHFVHGVIRRNSKLHTQFRVPTAESLHVQTPWQNIHACGDWIGHETPSLWMERATTTGIAAANQVLTAYEQPPHEILYPPRPGLFIRSLAVFVRLIRWIFAPVVNTGRHLRQRSNMTDNDL